MRRRVIADWIKAAAVQQVREHGALRCDIASDLAVSDTSISRWVELAIEAEEAAARRGPSPEEVERTAMSKRLAALEAENAVWRRAAGGALSSLRVNLGAGSAEQASDREAPSPLSSTGFPLSALPRQLDGEAQA